MRQYAPRHLQGAVFKAFRTHWSSEEFILKDGHSRFSLGSAALRLGKLFILHCLAQSARITRTQPGKYPALLKPFDVRFIVKAAVGYQALERHLEAAFRPLDARAH